MLMRRTLLLGMLTLCWLLPAALASAAVDDGDDKERIVLVGSVLVDREETAGDVIVVDGDVTIRGTVTGNVVAVSGLATLGRRGNVEGDLVYGDEEPVQAAGSQVGGDVEKFAIGDASIVAAIGLWIGFTISLLLLGLLLLLLAPRAGEAIARTGKTKPLIAALVGLLGFFLLPVIAIAACVTVIGLPLGIVLLLLILPLYAIGFLSTALVLGRLILKKALILAFVVGIVVLQLLTLIPIAGAIIGFLAVVFGLGVLLLSLLRARS